MTKEELFEKVLRERIQEAKALIGYSFHLLLKAIDEDGAVPTARRLIGPSNSDTFSQGLKELHAHGLLRYSVEQTVIDFVDKGYVFDASDKKAAEDKLRAVRLLA